ncbi:MAG TPA: acylphosphatase [Candidatus Margulisiibacteriota bacterium]|nr:acylphosphatase [Candidatus Margulisiibacteriota bacterium]
MKKQVHLYYSGRVQGVGFRFTAQEIASKLSVYGWVRNLSDGRVEIVAEAEEAVLKEFLGEIQRVFPRYVSGTEVDWEAPAEGFSDFRVRF